MNSLGEYFISTGFVLLFFKKELTPAEVFPIPLVDKTDFYYEQDFVGDLLVVGSKFNKQYYPLKDPLSNLIDQCTNLSNNKALGTMHLKYSKTELELLNDLVRHYPGKLADYLQAKNNYTKIHNTSAKGTKYVLLQPDQQAIDNIYNGFSSNLKYNVQKLNSIANCLLCLEHKPHNTIFGVCGHSNFGYPILWKNKQGNYKLIGITYQFQCLNTPKHPICTLRGVDIYSFLPWIHDIISTYQNINQDSYQNKKYLRGLSFTSEQYLVSVISTQHIATNQGSRCFGAYIHPGVVLTAAHCILEKDPESMRVVFNHPKKDYVITPRIFKIPKGYRSSKIKKKKEKRSINISMTSH